MVASHDGSHGSRRRGGLDGRRRVAAVSTLHQTTRPELPLPADAVLPSLDDGWLLGWISGW